jgi:hypothetical protein
MKKRLAIVNQQGNTVLEGPRFLIEDLALDFEIKYPGEYYVEEVVSFG